jgi:3-oxoacyl-[acyl-carrier protein] reductase
VAQHNVTINFILPGQFLTDRLRSNNESTAKKAGVAVEQIEAQKKAAIPAKRFGDPDEFGATCAFLCSAHAGFITGQNILIDGGIFPGAF